MDSLDLVRDIIARRDTTIYTVELAKALLKLADELMELRHRVVGLELDRAAHSTRIKHLETECTELADKQIDESNRLDKVEARVDTHAGNVEKLTDIAEMLFNLLDADHKLVLDVQEQLHRHLS